MTAYGNYDDIGVTLDNLVAIINAQRPPPRLQHRQTDGSETPPQPPQPPHLLNAAAECVSRTVEQGSHQRLVLL